MLRLDPRLPPSLVHVKRPIAQKRLVSESHLAVIVLSLPTSSRSSNETATVRSDTGRFPLDPIRFQAMMQKPNVTSIIGEQALSCLHVQIHSEIDKGPTFNVWQMLPRFFRSAAS